MSDAVVPRTGRTEAGTIRGVIGWVIAASSVASAAIHFSVIGEHFQEVWYFGVFFMVVAWAQLAWGVAIILRPSRRLFLAGAALQSALVVIYVWSRTTGLPIGADPWQPESVAFADLLSTVLEVVAAAGALVLVLRPHGLDRRLPRRLSVSVIGLVAVVVASLTSASLAVAAPEMGGMSDDAAAAMPGTDAPDASATLSLATTSPAGNIQWPLPMGDMEPGMQMANGSNCTATPSADQQAAAVDLVDQTTTDTSAYRSLSAAQAAGYIPITPSGRSVVHYVNPKYYAQTTSPSEVLNPQAPQSLVYANTPTGPVLVAAMYIMPADSSATPEPGGCLMQWHLHTNLCFNGQHRVVGADRNGSCPAGSTVQATQPMMHVWLAPIPGGPLAVDASNRQIMDAAKTLPAADPPSTHA
jgi:hypothetical protein